MELHALPQHAWLYVSEPRAVLVALIESLEQELAQMPHSQWHAKKRADRETGLAMYKRALARLDATAADRPEALN